MRPISKIELSNMIVGAWTSEANDMIYIFSDAASCLKEGSLDLLISNIRSGKYVLTTYSIIGEDGNIFVELEVGKSAVRSYTQFGDGGEIHLCDDNGDVLILKRL